MNIKKARSVLFAVLLICVFLVTGTGAALADGENECAYSSQHAAQPLCLTEEAVSVSPMPSYVVLSVDFTASGNPATPANESNSSQAASADVSDAQSVTTGVRLVRRNTPFFDFLLNYGVFLGAAALIVIAVIVTVIVLSIRRKQAE